VNLASSVAYWVVGQARAGCRRRTTGADRLQAGMGGAKGGGQAKIAMSRPGRGLWGGRAGKAIPPQSGVMACTNNN